MNPVSAQIAQDATLAKSRRVSMMDLPMMSGSLVPDLFVVDTGILRRRLAREKCLSAGWLASGKGDFRHCERSEAIQLDAQQSITVIPGRCNASNPE